MKNISCKWILMALISVFVLSCKKDSETSGSSGGKDNGKDNGKENGIDNGKDNGIGLNTTSSTTARYTQKATLEDHTGLKCGGCPDGHTYLKKAKTAYGKNVIPIELHGTAYEDLGSPFTYSPVSTIVTAVDVKGYPTVKINRTIAATLGAEPPITEVKPYVTTASSAISSTVGLAINSNLSGGVLSITVKSRFSKATSNSKLAVYVLESGVAGKQYSYYFDNVGSPFYHQGTLSPKDPITGQQHYILDYAHDGVLRTSASEILGDVIPSQAAAAEYSKTYTVTVPATWNSSNLSVAAMVFNSSNNVVNAQEAKVGQAQDFEILVK